MKLFSLPPGRITLLIILTLLLLLPVINASCECGYLAPTITSTSTLYTHAIETDFTTFTSLQQLIDVGDWQPQNYTVEAPDSNGPWGKNASLENIVFTPIHGGGGEGMEMLVRGASAKKEGGLVEMAEVATMRRDVLFGTLRAGIRFAEERGTCGAWFWYHNDTAELDIEYLSAQAPTDAANTTHPVNIVLQSPEHNSAKDPIANVQSLSFNPTDSIHEYRMDWSPTSVSFYADNSLLKSVSEGIPDSGGHLSLSHWSNGNLGWSAGPPTTDAKMTVKWVRVYFNSSDLQARDDWQKGCKAGGEVCRVQDGQAGEGVPKFLSDNGKGTARQNAGNGKGGQKSSAEGMEEQAQGAIIGLSLTAGFALYLLSGADTIF